MQVMIVDENGEIPCVVIGEADDCVYYVSEIAGCYRLSVRNPKVKFGHILTNEG